MNTKTCPGGQLEPIVGRLREEAKWSRAAAATVSARLMDEAADEIERLQAVAEAARAYFTDYLQDEADDVDCCVCGPEQHEAAKALRDALRLSLPPNAAFSGSGPEGSQKDDGLSPESAETHS